MTSDPFSSPWQVLLALALCVSTLLGSLPVAAEPDSAAKRERALLLSLDGIVGPASADHLVRGIDEAAEAQDIRVVVLRLDTPGGLDTSMREIIRAILASRVPVLGWVGPSGARAASAGTYILYASHVAAMAPGTNLGAATPVAIAGGLPGRPTDDQGDDRGTAPPADTRGTHEEPVRASAPTTASERKAINDAVAYIRSLAELRSRDADWAEAAVREAASLSANAAAQAGAIDFVAADVRQLLTKADGLAVDVAGRSTTLSTRDLVIDAREPDWRTRVLDVIANPNIALILVMLGVYGLLFEFINPGGLLPGTVGGISLLLGMYALAMLPLDYAGVGLLALGVALLLAEAFVPSFGILGIGGLVALLFGAAALVDVEGIPGFEIYLPLVAGLGAAGLALGVLVARLAVRSMRRRVRTGETGMLGEMAEVLDWQDGAGHVHLQGERWRAVSSPDAGPWAAANDPPKAGDLVRVEGVDGLTLRVSPVALPTPIAISNPDSRQRP